MSTTATGERRGRRGMIVLGKVQVPRPVNLPSQKLENRGLDPNVEIVPRGTVTWGNNARSPPTTTGNWGNGAQPSSPPVSGGAWGTKPTSAWGTNSSRPSSAGSTRPASAGGRHPQDLPRPSSAGNQQEVPPQNAWGPATSRPASASGPPPTNQTAAGRPHSAEPRPNGRSLLTSDLHAGPTAQPWGPAASRKPPEEGMRFTFQTGDFPSLGSDKNRPQQSRPDHTDDRPEERPQPSHPDSYQYEDAYPRYEADWNQSHFRGPPMESGYIPPNSWHREPPPHDRSDGTEEHWGGPNGPYVPPRFPNENFIPQRFGPYPGGAGEYGPPPFMRPMNPERPFAPGMFPGPYEGYHYGYPGYNMDEREMMMWRGPPYAGFHEFPRHPVPRPRHMPNHNEGFHPDYRGGKMKDGGENTRNDGQLNKSEPKRGSHLRQHGQRDWGNDEPMDFSKPVFEKEPGNAPPTKNHKVSFKAEPSVADVAILKKPPPTKPEDGSAMEGRGGDGTTTEVVMDSPGAATEKEIAKEKNVHDGVLGKGPELEKHIPKNGSDGAIQAGSQQHGPKDSYKAKTKPPSSVHDSEKEWRPKLQADTKSPSLSPQGSGDAEVASADSVYDYEAQRAKMKEIAAQRARQLQKEEEERNKEQKAKALAKLEELNRRTTSATTEAPPQSIAEKSHEPVHKTEMQFGTYQPSDISNEVQEVKVATGTGPKTETAKPEQGKRAGDRRGNRNRERSQQKREMTPNVEEHLAETGNASPEESQESQTASIPPPVHHRQSRQRGGQRNKQHLGKQQGGKGEAGKPEEKVESVEKPPLPLTKLEKTDEHVSDEQQQGPEGVRDGPPGNGSRRKRSGRNRQKNDSAGPKNEAVLVPSPTAPEPRAEAAPRSEAAPEAGSSTQAMDNKRYQRKFSGPRRSMKPQDVRISDKSHGSDNMVWAPVRTASSATSPDSNGQKNDNNTAPGTRNDTNTNSQRSRRAEMERYTPKPVKQQGPPGGFRSSQGKAQYQPKNVNAETYQPKNTNTDSGWGRGGDNGKEENAQWAGDAKGKGQWEETSLRAGKGEFRGGRRGRGGMRPVEIGGRVEKQRMVIDATSGAVPSPVVG